MQQWKADWLKPSGRCQRSCAVRCLSFRLSCALAPAARLTRSADMPSEPAMTPDLLGKGLGARARGVL